MHNRIFACLWILVGFSSFSPQVLVAAEPQKEKASAPSKDQRQELATDDEANAEADSDDELPAEAESSSTERISNLASIELGVAQRKGLGLELRIGWYANEDSVLGLKLGSYKAPHTSGFDEFTLTSLLLQNKFFLGNSFFVEGGLGISQIKVSNKEDWVASSSGNVLYGYDGQITQGLLSINFGNQWQVGSWTYGLDWMNLYLPFMASKVRSDASSGQAGLELRNLKDEQNLKIESWEIDYGISLHAGFVF